jgi:carboxylesterase type B
VFDNLGQPNIDLMTGGAPELQGLADAMADAWLAFARHGDPGWPAYDAGRRATMRFDLPCEVVPDPDPDLRRAWESIGL